MSSSSSSQVEEIARHLIEGSAAYDIETLLPNQRSTAKRVILGIQEIAVTETRRKLAMSSIEEYKREQWGRRPQNVYFLDGARGSGKTFVLMTILNIARQLGRRPTSAFKHPLGAHHEAHISTSKKCLEKLQQEHNENIPSQSEHIQLLEIPRHERTAIVLPTIFPVDTEGQGACMEVVFAAIHKRLDDELKKVAESRKPKIKELQARLDDMARRWAFSRNLGLEAILGDSINYDAFIKNRAKQSRDSNLRIDAWRDYINDFCETLDCALLVLGVDDTDVRPELTVDILHSLRIYLDHPRIVTVLAGNLRAMRQALVYAKFAELRAASAVLGNQSPTLMDWRRSEREEIEQYLEKVLPRWRRNFVGTSDPRTAREATDASIRMLFGMSLDEVCVAMLAHFRDGYTAARVLAALQYQENIHDRLMDHSQPTPQAATEKKSNANRKEPLRWDAAARGTMENFVSWWLFRHSYADRLLPSTVRQLLSLRHYVEDKLDKDARKKEEQRKKSRRSKRLSVIIFETADNFLLSQRFDDNDKVITEWLFRQEVTSSWRGQRWLNINGRRLPEGSYSYEAICFRIDLVFARPIRFHEDSSVPRGFLPKPAGVRNIAPFFAPTWLSDVPHFGLGAVLDHSVIPRNCIFVTDLRALPTSSFLAGENIGERTISTEQPTWEAAAVEDLCSLFGNDPRGRIMAYLNGRVAPYLRVSKTRDAQQSWLEEFDQCPLRQEYREWTESLDAGEDKRKPSVPHKEQWIVRYLCLFTALRSAWGATTVFINAMEHSVNNGKVMEAVAESQQQAEAASLNVRGTLSQDLSGERCMFLDFSWIKDAVGIVPWLQERLIPSPRNEDETRRFATLREYLESPDWLSKPGFKAISALWPDERRIFDETNEETKLLDSRKSRVLRHFLLYIIGLNTSLPALIHVELAAALGIGQWRRDDMTMAGERALNICDDWESFLVNAYGLITRLELEAARVLLHATATARPDLFEARSAPAIEALFDFQAWKYVCREKGALDNVKPPLFTFLPDISVSTLFGEPLAAGGATAEISRTRGRPDYPADSLIFRGLFDQARTNLWLGMRYITGARDDLENMPALLRTPER